MTTDGESFCGQCGSALDRGSRYCGSCGALVNRDRGKRILWLCAASLAVVGVAAVVLIGGLGGKPSGGSPLRPATSGARNNTTVRPIGVAMSLAPPNAGGSYSFEFTDVRAVASAVGVNLDQGSADQQDEAFGTQLNAAGGAWIDDQPSLWHEADVLWQSTAGPSSGTAVHATGLRTAFQFAAIERKFTRCNYAKRNVAGAVVYSGSRSAYARCAGEFGDQAPFQTQIGLLPAEHVVVLGSSAEAIDAAIRRQGDLRRDPTTAALVKRLAGYPAITVASGTPYCRELSKAFVGRNPTPAFVQEALGANPPGAPYVGLAFGSRFARRRATASLVFYYSDAETARRDLPFREHGLRTETSAQTNQPYVDLLRIGAAKADANSAVLDVAPRTGPLRLRDMWIRSDLAFARC